MWFINGPALRITAILTLENQADALKAESKNIISHLLGQYIGQPTTTLMVISHNLNHRPGQEAGFQRGQAGYSYKKE